MPRKKNQKTRKTPVNAFQQTRRARGETKPLTEGELEVFIQRQQKLVDDKRLKHSSGCPYKVSEDRFVVKFSVQADQKLGRNKYLQLLGNDFVRPEDLCKFKDDRSFEKWQHTCNGRREVKGELVLSKKALESKQFSFGIRGRTPKRIVNEAVPAHLQHLVCPISHELMKDPVMLESGHTYDRTAIERWLESNDTGLVIVSILMKLSIDSSPLLDPQTREYLISKKMTTNWAIKSAVEFLKVGLRAALVFWLRFFTY
jgi:hypothetical protein